MPPSARAMLALGLMVFSVFVVGQFGLVGMIAQGDGAVTWFFITVIVLPVLSIGVWKFRRA